jgi:hypothetical protein
MLCVQVGKERARHAALVLNLLAAQALLASGQVRVDLAMQCLVGCHQLDVMQFEKCIEGIGLTML